MRNDKLCGEIEMCEWSDFGVMSLWGIKFNGGQGYFSKQDGPTDLRNLYCPGKTVGPTAIQFLLICC